MATTTICWNLEAWSFHWQVDGYSLVLLKLNACNSSKLFEILDLSGNNNKSKREISGNIDSQ
jgi:hypothetical protein